MHSGVENRLHHDLDGEVWLTAWYEYAIPTPMFYPSDFKVVDEYMLDTFALYHQHITLENADSSLHCSYTAIYVSCRTCYCL